jgi:hypothetical protein
VTEWTVFLTPAIAGVGVFVAFGAIWWNRKIARLKATLDFIEGSESKAYYQERYAAFREFRRHRWLRERICDRENPQMDGNRQLCFDFLNHYEMVAIACRRGLIDEQFYMDWMAPAFIRDWNEAAALVMLARHAERPGDVGSAESYAAFESMAVRWGGQPMRTPWYLRG